MVEREVGEDFVDRVEYSRIHDPLTPYGSSGHLGRLGVQDEAQLPLAAFEADDQAQLVEDWALVPQEAEQPGVVVALGQPLQVEMLLQLLRDFGLVLDALVIGEGGAGLRVCELLIVQADHFIRAEQGRKYARGAEVRI